MLVHAVDFPALRARAHISGPDGPVDYVADATVDQGISAEKRGSGCPRCLSAVLCLQSQTGSFGAAALVSTSKSIRRMRSVQDSVLPWGCGGEASPHRSSSLSP